MKEMQKRRLFFVSCLVIIIFYAGYHANVQRYGAPISAFERPYTTSYGMFEVSAFPNGLQSCCILTVDDVSYHSSTSEMLLLIGKLQELGVHATFFVIPAHGDEEHAIVYNPALVTTLQAAQYAGFEVGQHGYTHTPADELRGLSFSEQAQCISRGRQILEQCFGDIYGFRPPSFWADTGTYTALEKQGYFYCGSCSLFNVFPYMPPGGQYPFWGESLDLLVIPTFPEDDLWAIGAEGIGQSKYQLNARWESRRDKGAPYVITTHLAPLMTRDGETIPGLEALSGFVTAIDDGTVWFPCMLEYARWHNMRCNLDISYIYDNNLLYIYIISEHDVSGLSITVTD